MKNHEPKKGSVQEPHDEVDQDKNTRKFVNPFENEVSEPESPTIQNNVENSKSEAVKPSKHTLREKLNPTSIFMCAAIAVCLVIAGVATFQFNKPQKSAKKSAVEALKARLDDSSSIKIIATSTPDSVFGRDYITDQEKMSINSAMMRVNDKVMKLTNNLDDFDMDNPEVAALMEKQMNTAASIRSLMHASIVQDKVKKFSGWKVKVEYEANDRASTIHSEYWAILDPSGKHVLFSFEIPIV